MHPSLDEVRKIAATGKYKRIPVMMEMLSDSFTPIEVMRIIRNASHQCYLLESASQTETWGRYTFLGYNPNIEVTCQDGNLSVKKNDGLSKTLIEERRVSHPNDTLREILAKYKAEAPTEAFEYATEMVTNENGEEVTDAEGEMVTEIAATLAFSAIQNNDKIGVIFFSDKVEKFIPPMKGRKHILYIIREMLNFKPESTRTDVGFALQYLTQAIKRRCTAFLISDFIDKNDFCQSLSIANRKHDVVAIQVYDKRVAELPNIGLVKMHDAETGYDMVVDTSSRKVRDAQYRWWNNLNLKLKDTFNRSNVDSVSIRTDQDYVSSLMSLFAQRG